MSADIRKILNVLNETKLDEVAPLAIAGAAIARSAASRVGANILGKTVAGVAGAKVGKTLSDKLNLDDDSDSDTDTDITEGRMKDLAIEIEEWVMDHADYFQNDREKAVLAFRKEFPGRSNENYFHAMWNKHFGTGETFTEASKRDKEISDMKKKLSKKCVGPKCKNDRYKDEAYCSPCMKKGNKIYKESNYPDDFHGTPYDNEPEMSDIDREISTALDDVETWLDSDGQQWVNLLNDPEQKEFAKDEIIAYIKKQVSQRLSDTFGGEFVQSDNETEDWFNKMIANKNQAYESLSRYYQTLEETFNPRERLIKSVELYNKFANDTVDDFANEEMANAEDSFFYILKKYYGIDIDEINRGLNLYSGTEDPVKFVDNIISEGKKKKGLVDSGAWNEADKEEYSKYDPPNTGNKGKSARKGFVG
jgi:hypothetical protein